MDETDTAAVAAALAAYKDATRKSEDKRAELYAAIAAAAGHGVRQNELVRITGYSREDLRQICRAEGPARVSASPATAGRTAKRPRQP